MGPFEPLLNALGLVVMLAPLMIYGFLWTQTDSADTRTRTVDAVCAIVAMAVGFSLLALSLRVESSSDPGAEDWAGLGRVLLRVVGVASLLLSLAAAAAASIPNASWRKPTMVMILAGMVASPVLFVLASVAAA